MLKYCKVPDCYKHISDSPQHFCNSENPMLTAGPHLLFQSLPVDVTSSGSECLLSKSEQNLKACALFILI